MGGTTQVSSSVVFDFKHSLGSGENCVSMITLLYMKWLFMFVDLETPQVAVVIFTVTEQRIAEIGKYFSTEMI